MVLLRLLRLPNLLILVATLYIVGHFVIYPALIAHQITPVLTNNQFYLVMFIILCLGAGGYVYNDIIDQASDLENNKRLIVGHSITRKIAYFFYAFLSMGPLVLVFSLAIEMDHPALISYYAVIVLVLWLYNKYLKKIVLIGNIVVAALCSFAVFLPFLMEYQGMTTLKSVDPAKYSYVLHYIWSFGIFCFFANLIREIVKDVEDMHGDAKVGYHTLPVIAGLHPAKRIILGTTVLFTLFVSALGIRGYIFFNWHLILILTGLLLPLFWLFKKSLLAELPADFANLSQFWKIYLLLGLLTLVLLIIFS